VRPSRRARYGPVLELLLLLLLLLSMDIMHAGSSLQLMQMQPS
jgi:hypothetical protein